MSDEDMEEDSLSSEVWKVWTNQRSGGRGRGRGSGGSTLRFDNAGSSKEENKRKDREDELGERERDIRRKVVKDPVSDLKLIIKFKEGNDVRDVGLIALTTGLKKACGEIEMAKVLRDGSLLVKCKDSGQREKIMKVQSICKKEIAEVRRFGERGARGVISGVALGENLEDIKKNIRGGTILGIKRLLANRDGEKVESTSVLLEFREQRLPERIMVGFMSFYVREYIPPPIRCFKCQRYGHVAAICKGSQRCGKCGGNHEYGQCGDGAVRKCCNCGGDHTAAYGGCPARKKAVVVQQVKTNKNLSYAEAVKEVDKEKRQRETMINSESLVLFIAYVINCTEQAKNRTEKIRIVVKAAAKFLNLANLSWEKIYADLNRVGESSELVSASPLISQT
ncbi:uncharacterized protein [Misgurnus anguillicaudatus]|uniref:uncharacterized protein n=1 Tax=Misgurnus anguillicaudatus TaxID=75329 RepID=UPI003CCF8C3F